MEGIHPLSQLSMLRMIVFASFTVPQGRRGPPGHREIVPVAPENRSDMGPQS